MKKNQENKKEIKINIYTALCSIFIALLLSYVIVDFMCIQPKIKANISNVSIKFDSLKLYLDNKLPELDSALIIHTQQLSKQTLQIKELTDITKQINK